MMSPSQVAERLSPRQFIDLCGVIDMTMQKPTKFDVLCIEQMGGGIKVLICIGSGETREVIVGKKAA